MNRGEHTAAFAKITRPWAHRTVQRPRLFRLLDARGKRPVTWVSGPAGSGKTTLVSSYIQARKLPCLWYRCDEGDSDLANFFYYMGLAAKKVAPHRRKPLPLLKPEYAAGIPTFSRRYFEELYLRVAARRPRQAGGAAPCPFVIVLDNYQDVPADSRFHEIVAGGLDLLPQGVRAIVISRSEPPPASARLQVSGKLGLLGYRDIRLRLAEAKALIRGRVTKPGNRFMERVYETTEGWAAGIILLLERARLEGTPPEPAMDLTYDRVFDYFAEEILNKTESRVQSFLLKTAQLPTVTVPLAERLTGTQDAARILSGLHRHHYFTVRLAGSGQKYQYHPLFRDFLLNRAKTRFRATGWAALQKEAGLLLEQSGQVEEAAALYGKAGDPEGLVRLMAAHARELLGQGRNKTVAEWIAGIPRELTARHPWLLYWNGKCAFPLDMPGARNYFEQAFESFKASGDPSGIYLSWAGIVDTLAFELDEWKRLDDWIAIFEELREKYPSFPSAAVDLIASSRMLISLTLRKTDRPEWVQSWFEHVSALLHEIPSFDIEMDTLFTMSLNCLWKGEYERNRILLERAEAEIRHQRPSPFSIIRIRLMRGIHYWVTAQYEAAVKTLSDGLQVSDESGVHAFDSLLWSFRCAAEIASGKLDGAERSLQSQMAALLDGTRTLDLFFYHINAAWHALLRGEARRAAENMDAIAAKAARMGTPYYLALWNIGMAQVAFAQGRAREAETCVQTALRLSLAMKSRVLEWYSLLISAYFLLQDGDREEGLRCLGRALSLSKRHGYVHLEFYQPSVMQSLCAAALGEGIEPDHVQRLIRVLRLPAPSMSSAAASCPEDWPYPVLIRTLGPFEIVRDGEAIRFPRKAPRKPLDLLKALIVSGGKNVSAHRLSDALWPDAEGDAAYSSFRVHLHHLRKLLGSEEAILVKDGRVTLNLEYCRLDLAVFQHLAARSMEARSRGREADAEEAMRFARRAIAVYRGNFLGDEEGYPEVAAFRERLRSKFIHLVEIAGRYHEAREEWQSAVELYEKGIEMDQFQEDLYGDLMRCCAQIGRYRDVESAYDRCRVMLHAHFGLEPSTRTKTLRDQLLARE